MTKGRIVITGANGFIGRALCAMFAARGERALALDVDFDSDWRFFGVEQMRCDLTDSSAIRVLQSVDASTVVHCGGVSGSMLSKDRPDFVHTTNILGALNVLEAARRSERAFRAILLSSIAVYGDHGNSEPVCEDAPLLAVEPYGASKVSAECLARSYRASFGLVVVALRIASVYGPGRRTPCLVNSLLASRRTNAQPVAISSHPSSTRQLLHIDDCLTAIDRCISVPALPRFAYNVVGPEYMTEMDVAQTVNTSVGFVKMTVVNESRYFDGHLGPLQGLRALQDFGFEPKITLACGVLGMSGVSQM